EIVQLPQIKSTSEATLLKKATKALGQTYTMETFEPLKTLGTGTFGTVTSAKNKLTGTTLVIKQIPKDKMSTEEVMKEVAVLDYLKPHCERYILCYDGFFEDSKNSYIVTEFLGDFVPLRDLVGAMAPKFRDRLYD